MRQVTLDSADLAKISTDILSNDSSFCFRAFGGSMFPLIRAGDILTIQPIHADALKLGDVAFYRSPGDRMTAHRIVGVKDQGGGLTLKSRGDASTGPAEHVQPDQVLGRVTSVQRKENTFQLDQQPLRGVGILWARLFPFPAFAVQSLRIPIRTAAWLIARMQAFKLYRRLAESLMQGRVQYRTAKPEDAQQIARLYAYHRIPGLENPAGEMAGQLARLEDQLIVATLNGKIAAGVTITQVPENQEMYPDWWIFDLYVRTRCRGIGIGERLSRMAVEAALEMGAERINLLVFNDNHAALQLYEQLGFQKISLLNLEQHLQAQTDLAGRRRIIMSMTL